MCASCAPCAGALGCLVQFVCPFRALLCPNDAASLCCRLCELHAAGNGIRTLPEQLAPFATLSLLRLPHNQLQMAAVASLGQLPALQLLDLSHNPLTSPAAGTQYPDASIHASTDGGGGLDRTTAAAEGQDGVSAQSGGKVSFPQLRVLDLSSSRVRQLQVLQELLGCMQGLAELWLANTPLAESCRAGKVQEQVRRCLAAQRSVLCWHALLGRRGVAGQQIDKIAVPQCITQCVLSRLSPKQNWHSPASVKRMERHCDCQSSQTAPSAC
jgi:hypothetical protein